MKEYAKLIRDAVANAMGDDYEVQLTSVLKNNGQVQKCLIIKKKGQNTASDSLQKTSHSRTAISQEYTMPVEALTHGLISICW